MIDIFQGYTRFTGSDIGLAVLTGRMPSSVNKLILKSYHGLILEFADAHDNHILALKPLEPLEGTCI